jgi:hypothetical protein
MPRLIILAAMLLSFGCAEQTTDQQPPAGPGQQQSQGRWDNLPTPPLSPRLGAVTAWTGNEAVFIGGDTSRPCPPTADCATPPVYAKDGAAYDPATRKWRRIADAPVPVESFGSHVLIGGVLYVWSEDTLLAYAVPSDRWTTPPTPPGMAGSGVQLGMLRDRLVAMVGDESGNARYAMLEPTTQKWTDLPPDPLRPTFDGVLTSTPVGLVLTAKDLVDQPGSESPAFVRAAVLDADTMTWRELPDSEQIGGFVWAWTGTRMVDPSLGGADGGEVNNYGRTYPYGGILDPKSGTWAALPNAPDEFTGGWTVEAVDGPLIAYAGWLYDDGHGTWTRLPRPEGAPPQPGSAVWAGDELVVLGGVDYEKGYSTDALSPAAWSFHP